MLSLYDTLANYIRKYQNESNSFVTIETHMICDQQRNGTITLKWWKESGMLLISHILLDTAKSDTKNVVTNTVNALLKSDDILNRGLKIVKLSGVANSDLFEKMKAIGWIHYDDSLHMSIS